MAAGEDGEKTAGEGGPLEPTGIARTSPAPEDTLGSPESMEPEMPPDAAEVVEGTPTDVVEATEEDRPRYRGR